MGKFNQDISNWNTSNVKNKDYTSTENNFNQDISNWNNNNDINSYIKNIMRNISLAFDKLVEEKTVLKNKQEELPEVDYSSPSL